MARLGVDDVVNVLGRSNCRWIGDINALIEHPSPLFNGCLNGISFHDSHRIPDIGKVLEETLSSIIITDHTGDVELPEGKALIIVTRPRNAYVKVVSTLFPREPLPGSIHRSSMVDPMSDIEDSVNIGPNCTLGRCSIGKCSVIEGNVFIGSGVKIGANVRIKPGAIIGGDGYSFERDDDGALMRFPHSGGVRIEDGVEIGSCTVIDRGTFEDTVIGEGTKVDNLCHIAHNVRIGRDCMIIAHVTLCGSSRVGNGTTIAPNAVVRDGVSVGSNVMVGFGSLVLKDVDDGVVVYGSPAKVVRKKEG